MKNDLAKTFEELEAILRASGTKDTELHDAMAGSTAKGNKRQLFLYGKNDVVSKGKKPTKTYIAGVIEQKDYAAFYYMPMYSHPAAFTDLPDDLQPLLKGKSCFYVRDLTPALKKQITQLIKQGITLYKKNGLL